MHHRILGTDALARIAYEQLLEEVATFRAQLWHHLREAGCRVIKRKRLEVRQGSHPGPCLLSGCPEELEDALQLVIDVAAWKEWSPGVRQLRENATSRPPDETNWRARQAC